MDQLLPATVMQHCQAFSPCSKYSDSFPIERLCHCNLPGDEGVEGIGQPAVRDDWFCLIDNLCKGNDLRGKEVRLISVFLTFLKEQY
jgi:hypothetical protein